MSVNITVNGKFAKHCRPHPLLSDPQEVRKAEEKERRKLRLLQVREESKKLAKKIRDEVNQEKKRELEKLQAIKQQELECWRQHALRKSGIEYRDAIFQIGTAHRAAKHENEQQAEKQKQQGTYKDFRKQMAARKSQTQSGNVQMKCKAYCPCQQPSTCANKQMICTCTQTQEPEKKNKKDEASKRKRYLSSSSSECEDEGYKEQTTMAMSSLSYSSSCDSTTTSGDLPNENTCFVSKPNTVNVDVEVHSDESVIITAPAKAKDIHIEYDRQFSNVVRVSPRKQRDNTCGNPSVQESSNTITMSGETTTSKTSEEKSSTSSAQFVAKEKRFTLISDLVKKQQNNMPSTSKAVVSRATSPQLSPRKSAPTTKLSPRKIAPTPKLSPRKTAPMRTATSRAPPPPASVASKSSKAVSDNTRNLTSCTATTKSVSSSNGRVQFYDYNSKLSKEQVQAPTAVSVQRQRDKTQPTAMEQAELENQREREKQLEALKKCQQMEERGQKALEREQVRRDCHELTEKLDALTREYPNQGPTNENPLHFFADKQLRREGKMNSAVEKLLQRPTIITCSELNKQNVENNPLPQTIADNLRNELNLGNINEQFIPADDVSSDSCCSILLGYVDKQSRLVKQDIQNNNNDTENISKQKRLKSLLKRLDDLRNSLVQELKNESESKTNGKNNLESDKSKFSSTKEENIRQVISSICEMCKEREQILINEKPQQSKSLRAREKELKAKEAILEEKVKEFYEMHKRQNSNAKTNNKKEVKKAKSQDVIEESSSKDKSDEDTESNSNDKENVVCASGENPLEIVITVRGESKCIKIPQKPKRKKPSKLSTLIKSPQTKKHTPKKRYPNEKSAVAGQGVLKRQNSYDSNSTSYMSLPAEMPNKIQDLADQIAREKQQQQQEKHNKKSSGKQTEIVTQITSTGRVSENHSIPSENSLLNKQAARLNPLVAQYVQRLLGMSRNAVKNLEVSSSEIDTPGSSVMETSGNIENSDNIVSDEQLFNITNFMEENRSFIKDLEQSIRTQNNSSLENSMRMFDEIWRKRLKEQKSKEATKVKKPQKKSRVKENQETGKSTTKEIKEKQETEKSTKETAKKVEEQLKKDNTKKSQTQNQANINKQKESRTSQENALRDLARSLSSHYSTDDKESPKSLKNRKHINDKAIDTQNSLDSNRTEPDSQVARYAKLTENCTHRIAELTELINRVRKEKQRILEITLSSVSENGRQSTEYLELPEGKSSTRNESNDLTRVSSSSEETTHNRHTQSLETLHEVQKLTYADRNKQITASRDSGIAESRPITAMENRLDVEPNSQASTEIPMPQPVRKLKPPPTIKRFSPQLPEEELAHELSTILEVDTPATSRINTAAGLVLEERENVPDETLKPPEQFPSFEQYIKIRKLNLDITQMDPEQGILLQKEFTTLLEYLYQRSPEKPPKYSDFPSINTYNKNLAESGNQLGETMEESLAQMHISGINPRNFPAVREYIKGNDTKSSSEEQQLIDTESLENITEEVTANNTENDTASLDIEAELKKRKILKNSFRFTQKQQIFSSTAHKDTDFYQEIMATESGIDKLSSSGNTTTDILDSALQKMVQQFPGQVKTKHKETKILSSTTTSANNSNLADSALKGVSLDDSSKNNGYALNLRDFLTRELLKRANMSATSSNSSSDDSLRSQFIHSLIGSLTPRTTGAASKSGALTLDRQKTSTPVPMHSTQSQSTFRSNSNSDSTQLFSGESRLSSVHYPDRSTRFNTSDGGHADHSSQ